MAGFFFFNVRVRFRIFLFVSYWVWRHVCQAFVRWQKLSTCFHQSQTSPSTLTQSSKWQGCSVVVVFGLFCSLFNNDGSKLSCCLGCGGCHAVWHYVSLSPFHRAYCCALSGGKLSQFSQMPSYSHLLGEERAILGIYLLKFENCWFLFCQKKCRKQTCKDSASAS